MKLSRMYFYWLILPLLFKEHATFEFMVESGTISFISNMKMKELTLEISADLTKESIDTFTKACEEIGKLMLAYPPLLADTTIHLGAQRSYSKSIEYISNIGDTGKAILKYLSPTLIAPNNPECSFTYSLVTQTDLTNIAAIIKDEWAKVLTTWTVNDLKTDHDKSSTVDKAYLTFEYELRDIQYRLFTLLNTLDSLASGIYPPNLQGMYYGITCLGVIKNEEILVKNCQGYTTSVKCLVEIWYPENTQKLPLFIPVNYEGIQLVGPNNEQQFVKSPLGSHYQALNCHTLSKFSHTVCQLHRLEQNCESSLVTRDLARIVKTCKFSKVKPTSSIRLADNSVLIQDKLAKVKVTGNIGSTQVMTHAPYQVHNAAEVSVESEGLTITYVDVKSTQAVKITNSSVPPFILQGLFDRVKYAEYWKNLVTASVFDYSLLGLQVVVGILFAVVFRLIVTLQKQHTFKPWRNRSNARIIRRPPVNIGNIPMRNMNVF